MNDALKAFLILVVVGSVLAVTLYVFNVIRYEYHEAKTECIEAQKEKAAAQMAQEVISDVVAIPLER
jgi:hypothetical protein